MAKLYGKLSFNAHEHISTTDVGRAILEGAEIFEASATIFENIGRRVFRLFHHIVNLWITSERNLLNYMLK